MNNYQLSVQPRKLFGRKVRSLRAAGIIPGNVFGKKTKSIAIQFSEKAFKDLYAKAGETNLIHLAVEKESKTRPVLVSGIAKDPVTGALLHVDFHQVDLKEKVNATIPLMFVGVAPAATQGLLVTTMKNEVEVEALPTDLPEHIEVDLSSLSAVGDAIHASDLKIDTSLLTLHLDASEVIAVVQEPSPVEDTTSLEAESTQSPTPDNAPETKE